MENKSYVEQMRDKIERLIEVTKGADDLCTAYIAGRLDARLDELEQNALKGGREDGSKR